MKNWIKTFEQLPPEDVIVDTKIEDENGVRNEQKLIRKKNLFFNTDLKTYVYYIPTHWKFTY